MQLNFNNQMIADYHSNSQVARILTEDWVAKNMFCPRCGNLRIKHFENNRPVADFYCPNCNNEFELKSKNGTIGHKINDGAYETMINRITGNDNPDFFFMSYSKSEMKVKDFVFVPKHFFVPDIIEKRKPLSPDARRAGWIGCNILLDKIPEQGRVYIVSNEYIVDVQTVVDKVQKCNKLEVSDMGGRGWLMDILNCINKIPSQTFILNDVYRFEEMLSLRHPQNNNIKPKIRQQLQFLRNKGFIEFLGNGRYKKCV